VAQTENVETRSIASEAVRKWGMLHVSRPDGAVAGWLVNSWSTSNEHRLPIRMTWRQIDSLLKGLRKPVVN
jgi:hypothetical protein